MPRPGPTSAGSCAGEEMGGWSRGCFRAGAAAAPRVTRLGVGAVNQGSIGDGKCCWCRGSGARLAVHVCLCTCACAVCTCACARHRISAGTTPTRLDGRGMMAWGRAEPAPWIGLISRQVGPRHPSRALHSMNPRHSSQAMTPLFSGDDLLWRCPDSSQAMAPL